MPLLQARLPYASILVVAFLTLASSTFSAEPLTTGDRVRERVLRMTEFFDTMLPGVLDEHNMTLHFKPKFSDLRDYEYMRFPFELRYGLTDRWELQAGLVPFTPNVFNRGVQHRWGLGEGKLGARYDIRKSLLFFDESTIGVETRIPLGRPPVELNDHYTHIKPILTLARHLRAWPSTTAYANVSYDRSIDLTHRSAPPSNVVRRNIIEVAPGLLFKPSELGYFAEYRCRHLREDYGWHLAHEIQFGTVWDIPLARSEKWKLPGKWQLELAYKISHEEGRDHDQGVSARVNWRTTLREVLEHTKVTKHR
jgi:hypothetical protein